MKSMRVVLSLGAFLALVQTAAAELYVVQLGPADGSGAAAPSNASTAIVVQKFANAGGSPLSSLNLPVAIDGANQPFTVSGSATSEGFLSLSSNGQYLTMAGYASVPGVASIAASASTVAPRAIARIEVANSAINTTTVFSGDTTLSTKNARSAISSNGTDLWIAGSDGGIRYATLGATTATQINTANPLNNRVLNIFNSQLYVSSSSGAFQGPSTVGSGLPTTALPAPPPVQVALLPGFPTAAGPSAYDYWFKDASTLYVADDRAPASGGGIQKWTFDSGPMTWSLAYTLGLGSGARGLAGTVDGSNAVLYATTAEGTANRLITITDSGASSVFSVLSTAATNSVYRGVEFVASAVTPPTNNADFNNDLIVDGKDFLIWQQGNGLTGVPANDKSTGDANGDHVVDSADLGIWNSKYGGAPAVGAAGAVPEPASLALGLVAMFGLAGLRRGAKNS